MRCTWMLIITISVLAGSSVYGSGPLFSFKAGTLIMHRETSANQPVVTDEVDVPLVMGSDFDTGAKGGLDLQAEINRGIHGLEFRFFDINSWHGQQSIFSPNGAAIYNSAYGGVGVYDVISQLSSQLTSAELNYRHEYNEHITFTTGFRWLSIDETLGIVLDGLVTDGVYGGEVRNDLFGFQLGVDGILYDNDGPFAANCWAKGGVYGNHARQNGSYANGVSGRTRHGDHGTSFVGDLGIEGKVYLTRHVSVSAGYQLLWVTGVALVSDQPGAVTWGFPGWGSGVSNSGDVFYHGLFLSVECLLP